jgi:type IV pilus assembly protein PilF
MKMRHLAALTVLLVAAGCASSPTDSSDVRPLMDTTGTESSERERARIHTELAAGYFELRNIGVALEEINIAMRADPSFGPAYNVAGLVYAELKDDQIAEQHFERALQINSLDSDAHNNYGGFLCDRKREEAAIRHFLAALRNPLYKTPERSYINAGLCSRRRGDDAAAEGYFERALKVRPNNLQALYQLAEISFTRADFAGAKTYLNRYARVANAGPAVLWLGVRVERKLGDRSSEANYARQLRRNFPDSKEARALESGQFE